MKEITTNRNDHVENEINDLEFHLSLLATFVLKLEETRVSLEIST